jgi:hypothetical protein
MCSSILLPNGMSRAEKGLLVNGPFLIGSRSVAHYVASHSSLHYHQHCLAMADSLKSFVNNAVVVVPYKNNNKQIIQQAILFLAKQGLEM